MNKTGFFQTKLLPFFAKLGGNKYLMALRNGIAAIMPFTIIGSLFTLITNFPVEAWTNFIEPYKSVLSIPTTVCMGSLSLVTVVSVTYQVAKVLEIDRLYSSFFALVSFLMICMKDGAMDTSMYGAAGLFPAIVACFITCKIIEFFTKKNIGIKMPEGVPQMVADAFNSIISGAVVLLFFWLITGVLGFDFNAFFTMILSPLVVSLDSLPGMLLITFISTLIWCCGINETAISGLTYPVWYALIAINTEAFMAGEAIPHIAGYGYQYMNFWLTGTGVTGGLVILMLFSRAKMYKSLGKVSLVPALFNINEPVAFGFPIVFNPIMMIPYIGVSLITTAISYFLMYFNIIGRVCVAVPWTCPPIISGFLLTGGDWRASVWQVVVIAISVIVYLPFFKVCERQQLEREKEAQAGQA